MCLIDVKKVKIKSMIGYKVFNEYSPGDTFRGRYHDIRYKINMLYEAGLLNEIDSSRMARLTYEPGFHFYKRLKDALKEFPGLMVVKCEMTDIFIKGFHLEFDCEGFVSNKMKIIKVIGSIQVNYVIGKSTRILRRL